jgi:hypothetical protein
MSILLATANTKLSIGTALASDGTDFEATDFSSIAWKEIGGTTNLGSAGDTSQLGTSDQIAVARTRKYKGVRNAGSMEVVCDLDIADEGQLALIAAEKTRDSYAFKVAFDDAPSGGTPSIRYFAAFVMSASESMDGANDHVQLHATLEIDSNIVKVAAAEGSG